MKVGVVGLGNFGTALAQHLAEAHGAVTAWTRDAEVIEGIEKTGRNPWYLSDVALSKNITATADKAALKSCDVVVFVVPSKVLCLVLADMELQENTLCVSAIKGLDPATSRTPLQCLEAAFGSACRYGVVSGPGFAKDIVIGKPAGLVAASKNSDDAALLGTLFNYNQLRVYLSDDTLGVELGGMLKNVVAIAAGIMDGLDLGDSARAGVITRGLAEMKRLAEAMGAKRETLSGLSGLGDLVLTATCDASRNRTVGLRLGKGESLNEIVESLGSVAEGVTTTEQVLKLAAKHGVEMPISEKVAEILAGKISAKEMVSTLLSRPITSEF